MPQNKKSKVLYALPAVVLSALLAVAIVYAWTEPTAAPPGNNVATPLNVSSVGQTKAGGLMLNTGGATNGLIVDKGNVGIGTTAPSSRAKLDVAGLIQAKGVEAPYFEGERVIAKYVTGSYTVDGTRIHASESINAPSIQAGWFGAEGWGDTRIRIRNKESGGHAWSWANDWGGYNGFSLIEEGVAGDRIFVKPGGNVGIGTTAPSQKLDVAGYVKGQSGLCIGNDCRTSWPGGGGCHWTDCYELTWGDGAGGWHVCNEDYFVVGVKRTGWNSGNHTDAIGGIKCCKCE